MGSEIGIDFVSPCYESYEKQAHNLKIAVAVDEFIHAFPSSLYKKFMHRAIGLCVTKPCAEISLCYAVISGILPPFVIREFSEKNSASLTYGIYGYRQNKEAYGRN